MIIIGGGAAGLTTGIRLLEMGISPIILEKENELGGAGIHAGRFFAVNTRWQQELNIVDSIEFAMNEWTDMTGSEPDSNIEDFITSSADTLEWIESFNINFETVQQDIGAGTIPRIHSLSYFTSPTNIMVRNTITIHKLNQTVTTLNSQVITFSSQRTMKSTPLACCASHRRFCTKQFNCFG